MLVEGLFEPEQDVIPEVAGGFDDSFADALAALHAYSDETDVALHQLVHLGRAVDLRDDGAECELLLRSRVLHDGVLLELFDQLLLSSPFHLLFFIDAVKGRHRAEGASLVAQCEGDLRE